MKKTAIIGMSALAVMCACNSRPTDEYTIKGTTDLADGELVRFAYYVGKDSIVNDSAVVANGAFAFTGKVDKPYRGTIYTGDQESAYQNKTMRGIIVEPGECSVALTGGDYMEAPVTGSALTAEMDSLGRIQAAIYKRMEPLRKQYDEANGDTAVINSLNRQAREIMDEVTEVQKSYVKNNTASMYAPFVMRSIRTDLTLDELKEIYGNWTPEVKASDTETAEYIKTMESIQPGAVAPEIIGKDQNGNDVSLSGLKGKVVLVDFWATWCGPCRASLPHVKEVYEKYNGKGLEVLAVSLDRDQDAWKKFIETAGSGLELYSNIYDEDGENAGRYAVTYIPSKFIIDAEGKMVGRFDDSDELDAKLAEMLGK